MTVTCALAFVATCVLVHRLVPTEQSKNFYAELVNVLGPDHVTLTLLDGASHGGPQFGTPENVAKVFVFLDKHLK